MSVLRFSTRDASQVEETWKQFVPSAALQRVDPERFRFDWFSAAAPGFSLVRYDLRAQIHSVVEPEDQLLACRVTGTGAEVRTTRSPLDAGSPWLTDGARVEARWESAQVSALVFDRRSAEDLAGACVATTRSACVFRPVHPTVAQLRGTGRRPWTS